MKQEIKMPEAPIRVPTESLAVYELCFFMLHKISSNSKKKKHKNTHLPRSIIES